MTRAGRAVTVVLALAACVAGAATVRTQEQRKPPVRVRLTRLSPSSGQPAITTVNVDGDGFPKGPIPASKVRVTLAPERRGAGPTASTTATHVTLGKNGHGTVAFLVPAALVVASPVRYEVSLAGTTSSGISFTSTTLRFTVNPPPPRLASLTPTSGKAGTSLKVTLEGAYTHFKAGVTRASFGAGISVGGAGPGAFGPVTVLSPTRATASLTISKTAAAGSRGVTVKTAAEQVTIARAFTVTVNTPPPPPPPTITASAAPPKNPAGWNNTDVTVTFTCTNATACGPNRVVTTEGAGQVISGTASGAGGTASTSVTLNIDKTPPSLAITTPSDGDSTTSTDVVVSGTVNDSLSGLVRVICGTSVATVTGGTFTCPVSLALGDNTIAIAADDAAGNSALRTIHVIRQAINRTPTVTITTPAQGTLFSTGPITVAGTVDDATATVVVDGVTASVSNGTFSAVGVGLREGLNIITASGTSGSGAVGSGSVSVLLDTTAPRLLIQAPADGSVLTAAQVPVAGMVNDIVSGTVNAEQVTVTVNGIDASVANRSFFVPEVLLVRGVNTIRAVARDRAGNERVAEIHVTLRDTSGAQVITRVSGDGQTAAIGGDLGEPLVAQLLDANGQPVADRPVTFTVTRSDGVLSTFGAEGQQLTVQSDSSGLAALRFRVGSRVGAGINEVVATSPGFAGQATYCATSTASAPVAIKGAGVMGETHRGIAAQALPLPLEAVVFDAGGNPAPNVPVTFTVLKGGGTINGLSEIVQPTNSDGRVAATLVLGPDTGANANVVRASFAGQTGQPVTFTATGYVPGPAASTRVSGVVLDNTDSPVPGATAKIVGTPLTAVTDSVGRFTIDNAPVGTLTLIVDGSTSTRPERFPFLAFMILAIPGQDNTIGMPIYLPPLDAANSKVVGGDDTAVLTMKDVPGVAFTVFPHSATFPDGSRIGRLSLSQVHADKVPMPPPNGSTPRVVWTLQPAGVKFDPPIKVQLPNTDGYVPGQVVEVFQFDHDLEQFVSVGPARVSADGSVLVTDPGFGTTKAGWGAPQPPPPPPTTDVGDCSSGSGNGPSLARSIAPAAADSCTTSEPRNGQCVDVPVTLDVPSLQVGGGSSGGRRIVKVGQAVSFSAGAGGSCNAVTLLWDFGDGSAGAGATESHTYANPGEYHVTVQATCSSCSSLSSSQSTQVLVVPDAQFTEVRSEQVPGARANFLPKGVGADNPVRTFMVVGTTNGRVKLSADIQVGGAGLGGMQLAVGIRRAGEAETPATTVTATTFAFDREVPDEVSVQDYAAVIGVDADNNGTLSDSEIIHSLGTIKVVTQARWLAATLYSGAAATAGFALGAAHELIATFLGFQDSPFGPAESEETIQLFTQPNGAYGFPTMDQNAGLLWTSTGSAVIKRYTWPASSSYAEKARDADATRTRIIRFLIQSPVANEIIQWFIDHPTETVQQTRVFHAELGVDYTVSDPELAFSLANCTLNIDFSLRVVREQAGVLPGGVKSVVVDSMTLDPEGHHASKVEDLYDWDFNNNTTLAIIEAGYPSIPGSNPPGGNPAGRIFWNQLDLTGTRSMRGGVNDLCYAQPSGNDVIVGAGPNPLCSSLPDVP